MSLNPGQKRYLRGLAHALSPVVMLGNKGVTQSLVKEFSIALDRHELVKVKLSGADKDERGAQIAELAQTTGAESVQAIGKVATFYRRNADEPKLMLPK